MEESGNIILPRDAQDRQVLVLVAYPGDETLWVGGHILTNPNWHWAVLVLFKSSDEIRQGSFLEALERLGAKGEIVGLSGTTDDKKNQNSEVSSAILRAVDNYRPDLLITHNPYGECARHHGRNIVGQIVCRMWEKGKISVPRLGFFAYEDNRGQRLPWAMDTADWYTCLPSDIWAQKRDLLLGTYRFDSDSFVAKACPREEGLFWFTDPKVLRGWLQTTKKNRETLDDRKPPKRKKRAVA